MIRIGKSGEVPRVLIKKGKEETIKNCRLYDEDPQAYQQGDKKFDFKSGVYGHDTVKEKLKQDQFEKCCFCEAKFTANGYGDVEHFRPKAGYQAEPDGNIEKPGYYWLAYDWDNLFFSCQICNQQYKKNYFPLAEESGRAKCHHDAIDNETPLLIHPSLDDPEEHIVFRQEVPYRKTDKGEKSIAALGLNRETLNERRGEYLNNVRNNLFFSRLEINNIEPGLKKAILGMLNMTEAEMIQLIEAAKIFIDRAARSSSEFSGMVRCNFPGIPR